MSRFTVVFKIKIQALTMIYKYDKYNCAEFGKCNTNLVTCEVPTQVWQSDVLSMRRGVSIYTPIFPNTTSK